MKEKGTNSVAGPELLVELSRTARTPLRAQLENGGGRTDYGKAVRDYLRRDFHPSQDTRCDELARRYAADAGL